MKKIILAFCGLLLTATITFGQQVQNLVREGIALHEEGDYKGAIKKYDEALELAPGNITIMYEKAYSYQMMGKCQTSIKICEQALKENKKSDETAQLYLLIANCEDVLGNHQNALKTYDRALKKYDDFHLLHFNKAVTLLGMKEYADARKSLEQSIRCNPAHASSHYFLSLIVADEGNTYPALLAASRFLALELEGKRAEIAYPIVQAAFNTDIEQTDENEFTINLSSVSRKEDNFMHIELMVSLAAAPTDNDSLSIFTFYDSIPFSEQTELQRFTTYFNMMCGMLEDPKDGKVKQEGFFHEYYSEFFRDLQAAGHIEAFCIVINAMNEEYHEEIKAWILDNEEKADNFFAWMSEYLPEKAEGKQY